MEVLQRPDEPSFAKISNQDDGKLTTRLLYSNTLCFSRLRHDVSFYIYQSLIPKITGSGIALMKNCSYRVIPVLIHRFHKITSKCVVRKSRSQSPRAHVSLGADQKTLGLWERDCGVCDSLVYKMTRTRRNFISNEIVIYTICFLRSVIFLYNSLYSCFEKGCPINKTVLKRQCQKVLWVMAAPGP